MTQPSKPLKPSQKRTLDALKIAIQRVDIEQLPEDLREKIKSIERESSEYNYQVIDEIIASIENISHFNAAYQKARDELTKDYNSKEKTKIASSYPSNHSPSRAKTEQEINPKALFILQELENYPLTLEDLKYRLNLKSEEVHQIVKQLWNERKVNKVSGSIWYSLFPITKPRRFDITEDDSHTSFTLTTLGEIELRRFSNYR
ncbi:hypothetical protein WH8501_21030 [Crocosphaera watsonii WH 8501]|uniref:Uncharacterized protein n=5 Tax=Crocosphaera watsonii TaxID=263511 RepID=Q4C126_CROWT|nr:MULTISPECIES: hypothetical protein [Crocosphaera]EAM49857.1 hypothetical protein CwatDRAFT_2457 [Crocosphaera watsonii WH 8501]EHJ11691.1 hypothetical protein CWATWH0003_3582 [Crocosphaera watsonii WH 0003]MCH2246041.1 hypothetical protein [Crocosphaera sp.]NQZ61379.1 hypothetical protein [Crocosphaera sp.]CCQ50266.1 hypothetical protein CWATWH8502_3998 [Crocosphaera watsonii WH 8502]